MVQRKNLLPFDGEVYLYDSFFSAAASDLLFESLKGKVAWKQEPIKIMGKEIMQPRLTALYGDLDKAYTYSGTTMSPAPWFEELLTIKDKVEAIAKHTFTTALLNYYRNGLDSMGWHRDNETSLGTNPCIASISFGATRSFLIRHYRDKHLKIKIELSHGSLLLMKRATQHNWMHSIPKQPKMEDSRINITFRAIKN